MVRAEESSRRHVRFLPELVPPHVPPGEVMGAAGPPRVLPLSECAHAAVANRLRARPTFARDCPPLAPVAPLTLRPSLRWAGGLFRPSPQTGQSISIYGTD